MVQNQSPSRIFSGGLGACPDKLPAAFIWANLSATAICSGVAELTLALERPKILSIFDCPPSAGGESLELLEVLLERFLRDLLRLRFD